jgi:hypothetical protein
MVCSGGELDLVTPNVSGSLNLGMAIAYRMTG